MASIAFANTKAQKTTKTTTTTQSNTKTPALTPAQKEIRALFDAKNTKTSLVINGKVLQQMPNSQGLTRIFSGVEEQEVKDYFSRLTGKPLSAPRTIPNKGIIYVSGTPHGNFTLRDFASSGDVVGSAWTIDIPKSVAGTVKNPQN